MDRLSEMREKYGVGTADPKPASNLTRLEQMRAKYVVADGAGEALSKKYTQSSGVYDAPETFTRHSTTKPTVRAAEAPSEVVAGTGLGVGVMLPSQQQAASMGAKAAKQMHEQATKDLEQLKKDERNASWKASTYNPESENFKTRDDWSKERSELEDKRDAAAKNYYTFAGQDSVNKVLSTPNAAFAFNTATEAAAEISAIKDKHRNGGWNAEAATALKNAAEKQARAVELLVSYGVDKDTAERAVEYQASQIRQGKAAAKAQETAEWAKEHKGAASVLATVVRQTGGLDYLGALTNNTGHNNVKNIETYRPLTSADFQNTTYAEALQAGASADMGPIGKELYSIGMSMADDVFRAYLLGPMSSVLSGSSIAASVANDALRRGGTNGQALTSGLAAGAAEYMMDKLSMDELLNSPAPDTWTQWLHGIKSQAFTEAREELLTEVANILSDAAIMGQKSSFNTAVRDYQREGMSEEAAKRKAFLDNIVQVGLAAAGGFISGGIMSGAKNAPSVIQSKAYQKYLSNNLSTNQINVLSVAQEYAPDSETRKMADSIAAAINSAAENNQKVEISQDQWGRLMKSMVAEQDKFGPADPGAVSKVLRPKEETLTATAQAFIDAGADPKTANTKSALFERIRSGDSSLTVKELTALQLDSKATRQMFKDVLGVELPGVTDGHVLSRAALDVARNIASQQAAQTAEPAVVTEAEANLEAEIAQMAQDKSAPVAEPTPDAAEPAPDAAEPAPDVTEPAPDVTEPAPDVAEPAPDAAEPAAEKRASAGQGAPATEVRAPKGSARGLLDYVTRVNQSNAEVRKRTQETTAKVMSSNLKALGANVDIKVEHHGAGARNAWWSSDGIVVNADALAEDGKYKFDSQHAIVFTLAHEIFHEASHKQGGEMGAWTRQNAEALIAVGKKMYGEKAWEQYRANMKDAQISAMVEAALEQEKEFISAGKTEEEKAKREADVREKATREAEARLTEAYLDEEMAADVLSQVFQSTGKLNLFAKEQHPTLVKIRDWMQKKFDTLLGNHNGEYRDLIKEMNRILKNVNEALTNTEKSATEEKSAADKAEEPGQRETPRERYSPAVSPDSVPDWDAQVNAFMNGTFDELFWGDGRRRSSMYVMFEPTALLQDIGLSDLPLVMTQDHAKGFHGLTEAQFRKLPELIRHPVAVFRDDPNGDHAGGINILTSERDKNGDPIFIAIKPDQPEFTWDKKSGPAHFVNVFGRKHAKAYVNRVIEDNGVLFVDKEKFDADPWLAQIVGPSLSTADSIESNAIIGQKRPTVKPGERRFSVTPEMDAKYMDAVSNGDMEKAQRMVDEAANVAFSASQTVDYRTKKLLKVYHATNAEFTVFDKSKFGTNTGSAFGEGFYFTDDAKYANTYAKNVGAYYLNVKRPYYYDSWQPAELASWLTRAGYDVDKAFLGAIEEGDSVLEQDLLDEVIPRAVRGAKVTSRDFSAMVRDAGYDGIIAGEEYIAFEPEQIKSADPVTYDDNGNVVPLSERFNPENDDIRFSVSPEMDAEYMTAVNNGDVETAQRMVDEAAKAAGYTVKSYHGSHVRFNVFSHEYAGGLFNFTPDKYAAQRYAFGGGGNRGGETVAISHDGTVWEYDEDIDAYIAVGKANDYGETGSLEIAPYEGKPTAVTRSYVHNNLTSWEGDGEFDLVPREANTGSFFISPQHTLDLVNDKETARRVFRGIYDEFAKGGHRITGVREAEVGRVVNRLVWSYENDYSDFWGITKQEFAHRAFEDFIVPELKKMGYDSIYHSDDGHKTYVVFDPNQIKSADPVTYDANGDAIPLSERFNPENDDIRFSASLADTNTPEFRAWFNDDSGELTNPDGTPKVFLRGDAYSGATKFFNGLLNYAAGVYHSTDMDTAQWYATAATTQPSADEFVPRHLTSWTEAFQWVENGGLGNEVSLERSPDGWEFAVRERGRGWRTLADYPNTAEGLARFNAEYGDLMRDNHVLNPGYVRNYLTANKTLVIDAHGGQWQDVDSLGASTEDTVKQAWADGYDCVVIKNVQDGAPTAEMEFVDADGTDVYHAKHKVIDIVVVRDSGQVKSVYNTGTFDRNNPDVRYSADLYTVVAESTGLLNKMVDAGVAASVKSAKNKLKNAMPDNLKWFVETYMSGPEFTDEDRKAVGVLALMLRIGQDAAQEQPEVRYSAGAAPSAKKPTYKHGGNTGNVNPETGFRRGSVADSFMRIWNTGAQDEAIGTLEYILTRLAELEAEAQERNLRDLRAATFKARVTPDIAERNRQRIERLIDRYGMIPQTSGAQQPVRFPEQISETTHVAGATQTIMSHEVTNELIGDELVQDILSGNAGVTYARVGDRDTLSQVDREFEREGVAGFMRQWKNKVNSGEGLTKLDIARAEKLYVELAGAKEFTDESIRDILNLVAEISAAGTQAGQTVQAMTLLKKMTPTGQLYYIQKAVDRLNRSPSQKTPITINEQLAQQLASAKTIAEINKAVDAIVGDIAKQVPVSLADKWNTWRYFAMLGNPRTHIRNLFGNAIFAPARLAKNVIGTGLERVLLRGEKADQRTKAIVSSKELRDFAEQDAEEMKDILRGGGKYNTADMIRDKRIIFGNVDQAKTRVGKFLSGTAGKATNFLSQKNSEWLEKEDWGLELFGVTLPGLKTSYVHALAGFLSARGITDVNTLLDTDEGRKVLNEAREYAVREAHRATYRDASKLASMLNSGKRNLPKPLNWLLEGIVPFTKTPVNIVKRGFEYSPLGILKTAYDAANRAVAKAQREHGQTVKRDLLSAADVIDELAANLTGTGVAVLGVLLSRLGLLTAGLGEDDEDKFKELYGDQAYSLSIPGVGSYTIDWMAPVALPLFVGAEIYNTLAEDYGDLTPSEIVDAIADGMTTILEPMLSLSMLDGVNEALSANKFGDSEDAIWNVLSAALGSYASQGLPTALGQVARTLDPNRRTTFTEKGEGKVNSQLQRFWQSSVQGKVPFYEEGKLAYVDAWGRTDTTGNVLLRAFENFISPGYINSNRKTGVEAELERLAAAEKDTSVMPDRAAKYFSVNKETYAMSKEEYEAHLIDRGQTSYRLVSEFINDPAYQQMSDKDRVSVITDLYEFAKQTACYNTNNEYDRDSWVKGVADYVQQGGDAVEYITMRHTTNGNPSEAAYARDDLTAAEVGTLVLSDTSGSQRAPSAFTDPSRSGYQYELDDEQKAEYTAMFDEMFREEFAALYASSKYSNADAEKRKELVAELRREVAEDVKRAIARQLRRQGVKSTKK